ncbi:Fungal-trans-2 domain containing protein [Pyrenophora tritici-repentis]|uniref:Fungal-trans-2 domain containing protein n=2 Tax=Pyrenophora tritici-repentis TaxID=45151 RepID=A0A2W1CPV7_9PLEO|nr:uncharacterized protein PTRG_08241 [Pyrenophora tritici-repentis Pt-1C-BFP]KAA8615825.1 hypothetical protein PtrV1_11221 [Pyrenophora tritici-repentis]EDU51160.1 conserved hypothetical protein [Pyrenophora tritici-repentis Pt-1C-BFP]KAF7443582.1 hypothetical protein A1F99_116560 [Pyrenophora tritici-repentis]KAF7566703.1 Fungal-trans-2 domain containing protein [Pyrenophora tritici-repentis]KAG9379322.1 hypothetical protein A1F94_009678 [Pyrenophora tritici-repentis]
MVFVEGKIVKSRRSQRSKITPAASASSIVPTNKHKSINVQFVDENTSPSNSNQSWQRQDIGESVSLSPDLQVSIPDVRLRFNPLEVYICHLRCHLYPNGPVDLGLQSLTVSDLAVNYASARTYVPLFNQAAISFATLFFGAQHRENRILTEGYTMHGVALRRLNKALSIPGCHSSDEVLVSVVILAMLELYMPSGPRNYLKHMLGLERLLELRDPGSLAHASYRTLELYKGMRHMILIASLRNRSPSIFASPRWKAVLRTALSLETPEEQDLHDVLADSSVLIAASDEVADSQHPQTPENLHKRAEVERKASGLLEFLRSWKDRWDSAEGNQYGKQDDPIASTDAPTELCTLYRFANDSVGRMFMLYNTALIYVHQIYATLAISELASSDTATSDIFTNGNPHGAIHAAGIEIARSITDYLQHKRVRGETDFASPVVQWAVLTAWQALGGSGSREGEYMTRMLNGNATYEIVKAAWNL